MSSCSQCESALYELKVLCSLICVCNVNTTHSGKGQNNLKQQCVSTGIDWIHESGQGQHILPEVGYFMQATPPMPLLKSNDLDGQPEHIRNVWHRINKVKGILKEQGKEYNQGDLRIPDIVITHDPKQPPVQSNIKQVVEIKFPGDRWGEGQKEAYKKIAGKDEFGKPKLTELSPNKCGCGDDNSQEEQIAEPIPELKEAWEARLEEFSASIWEDVGIAVGGGLLAAALFADDALGLVMDDPIAVAAAGRAMLSGKRIISTLFSKATRAPNLIF